MDLGPLLDRARQRFSPDRFLCVPRVAEWCEHTVPAYTRDDGTQQPEQRYGKAELEQITAACNRRIANTGDFAALSYGHPDGDGDIPGYAGPFYVDRLGDVDPVWAIYAYEWHDADDARRLEKRPRRSVELRKVGSPDQWYFDPIAALGVDTPRLPLGHAGPPVVEMYSLAMSASGTNTFVPGVVETGDRNEEERYSMDADALDAFEARLLENIANLPGVKWATEQAAKAAPEETPEEPETPGDAADMESPEGTDAQAASPDAPEAPKGEPTETYGDDPEPKPEDEPETDDDDPQRLPSKVVTEHYSLDSLHPDPFIRALQKEIYSLRQETEERKRRDTLRDREAALRDFFSGDRHFTESQRRDIEKECYSLDMSHERFTGYLKTLASVAPKKPSVVSKGIPNGTLPAAAPASSDRAFLDRVEKYHLDAQRDGRRVEPALWEEAKQAVKEGREYVPMKRGK